MTERATDVAALEAVERDACADFYAAAPAQLRREFGIAHRPVGDGVLLRAPGVGSIVFNRLLGFGASAAPGVDELDAALAELDGAGAPWVVQVAPTATSLSELARARGLEPHPRPWVRFERGGEPATPARTGLAVRPVDPEAAEAFGAVVCASFGLAAALAPWPAALVGRPGWLSFLAWDGREPVAAGALYLAAGRGWLGFGGTLAPYRGRGAQGALLAARIEAGRAAGCHGFVTETGVPLAGEAAPSLRNIERAGFRRAYLRPNLRRPEGTA